MAQTSEGAKKAAQHQDMSEKGRKGTEALNADQQKKSEASHKASETRNEKDPDAFRKMGEKGGSQSHGGGRSGEKDE